MREIAGLSQFRANVARAKSLTLSAADHLKNGEPDKALDDLASALTYWKDNPAAYYLKGLAFEQKLNRAEAHTNLERRWSLNLTIPKH